MFGVDVTGVLAFVLVLGLLLAGLLVGVSLVGLLIDRAGGRTAPHRATAGVGERLARLDELLMYEEITLEEHARARMTILTER